MWMRVDRSTSFAPAPVPEWVKDWLSRRRGTSSAPGKPKDESKPKPQASIRLTETAGTEAVADAKAEQRAAAARERNRLDREAAVLAGLEDLDLWLLDQVQHGMANFVAQAAQSCRTISQRLVDAKAKSMLGRAAAIKQTGVNLIVLLALSDSGHPAYEAKHAEAFASFGCPVFACTPDQFPSMMACALTGKDLRAWAAEQDVALIRGS
jgi:hypothetical protein